MLLELLGIRKRRKKKEESTSPAISDSAPRTTNPHETAGVDVTSCAGCRRLLDTGAIYEMGKAWCTDCYKTQILKIQN
jgi:hypothetical protein